MSKSSLIIVLDLHASYLPLFLYLFVVLLVSPLGSLLVNYFTKTSSKTIQRSKTLNHLLCTWTCTLVDVYHNRLSSNTAGRLVQQILARPGIVVSQQRSALAKARIANCLIDCSWYLWWYKCAMFIGSRLFLSLSKVSIITLSFVP